MKDSLKKKITLYALLASLTLTGCGEKSNCEIPTSHVHKYTKEITDGITIETYFDSESLNKHGYTWNEEYVEINKVDESFYKTITRNNLFNGIENFDYLYYLMSNKHDYLEFYYEYYTTETYTTTDSEGNVQTHTRTVHHDGWHTNPHDSDNTGRTRLNHHRYYAYQIVYKNDKFTLNKSEAVDDIRYVLNDYPYVLEDPTTIVSKEFNFNKHDLPYLSVNDFNTFNGPDLMNHEPTLKYTK